MKTTINQIATGTIFALILMVGNVQASELKASNFESIETERTLQLETWMTNETTWNTNFVNMAALVEETESSMEIENWMTDAEMWNANNRWIEEAETGLEIEDWMINDNTWNAVNIDNDSKLVVESWMINENIWK